ncbi:MAG: HEAT repeat domain-containing protein, partial [Planctomycetota bacterium]|nr:HEAT repeat domain-containing protein [Planctomycetota bacterium]
MTAPSPQQIHPDTLQHLLSQTDLITFRKLLLEILCESLDAPLAWIAHPDPHNPQQRIESCQSRNLFKTRQSSSGSSLTHKILEENTDFHSPGDSLARDHRQEIRLRCGSLPQTILGYPLRSPAGVPHSVLILGQDGDPQTSEAFLTPLLPLLGSLLEHLIRCEKARIQYRDQRIRLGVSCEWIGNHPTIALIRNQPYQTPRTPLLVLGSTGTGKTFLVHYLHQNSDLSIRPVVELNPQTQSAESIQQSLFQNTSSHPCLLEQPIIIHIEEALSLPLETQSALLERLPAIFEKSQSDSWEGAFLILCSSDDIPTAIQEQRALPQLLQLFQERHLILPPLRERPDDLPLLAEHFLQEANGLLRTQTAGFTHRAIELMKCGLWPENLTQLRRVIHQGVLITPEGLLDAWDLEPFLPPGFSSQEVSSAHLQSAASVDERTIFRLLKSPNLRDRTRGLSLLDKRFYPATIPLLLKETQDPEYSVRQGAYRILARHGDPELQSQLLEKLSLESNPQVLASTLHALAQAHAQVDQNKILVHLRDESIGVRLAALEVLSEISDSKAAEALDTLLVARDPRIRCQALVGLAQSGREDCWNDLIGLLQSESDQERIGAASALSSCSDARACQELQNALAKESSIDIQIALIEALGKQKNPQALETLKSHLDSPIHRFYVIEALGHLEDSRALPDLLSVIKEDSNSLLRRSAIHALARIGDSSITSQLSTYLDEPFLAATILEAVCQLGGSEAEEALLRLIEPEHPLCLHAIRGLRRIGTERSVKPLIDLLGTVPDYMARFIAETLSHIGTPAIESLIESLDDESQRYWAIISLGDIGSTQAVKPLMAHYDYASEVPEAISKIGPEAIDPLLEILPARQEEIRDFLISFGSFSIPAILSLLDRDDCLLLCSESLSQIGNEAAQPLLERLETADPKVRERILRILGKISTPLCIPVLCRFLDGEDRRLQRATLEGIGRIEDARLLESLLRLTQHPDPQIVLETLDKIRRLRPANTLPLLTSLQSHSSAPIRTAALQAIAAYGKDVAISSVRKALQDKDPSPLQTAVRLALSQGLFSPEDLQESLLDPSTDSEVRSQIIRQIAALKPSIAIPLLFEGLLSNSLGGHRTELKRALQKHG